MSNPNQGNNNYKLTTKISSSIYHKDICIWRSDIRTVETKNDYPKECLQNIMPLRRHRPLRLQEERTSHNDSIITNYFLKNNKPINELSKYIRTNTRSCIHSLRMHFNLEFINLLCTLVFIYIHFVLSSF